jgi:hypothetical protein
MGVVRATPREGTRSEQHLQELATLPAGAVAPTPKEMQHG